MLSTILRPTLRSGVHLLLLLPLVAPAQSNYATPYAFTTVAGASSVGTSDGPGHLARFQAPASVAIDPAGNIFVADALNSTIRKIASDGRVTTFAGEAGSPGTSDGIGQAARFDVPLAVATDAAGNVFVADVDSHTIRKITPAGQVTTLAGTPHQSGSANGTGAAARFNRPESLAVDPAGNLFVADTGNHTIRKISAAGLVTTFAGLPGQSGYANGPAATARFAHPVALAADNSGNVFVADRWNSAIRKIDPDGNVVTIATFIDAYGLAVDPAGNLAFSQSGNTLGRLSPAGGYSTLAGTKNAPGSSDGFGAAARFGHSFPLELWSTARGAWLDTSGARGVAYDRAGNLVVADIQNNTIRRVDASGAVSTLAGLGAGAGATDGRRSEARFGFLTGVAVDASGNLFVADTDNHLVRKITADGMVSTVAGGAGLWGDADGAAGTARFSWPQGVAVDAAGNIYIADTSNKTIRHITPGGLVSTLAGKAGQSGAADGDAGTARFQQPTGLAFDSAGNLFVADYNVIRKITPGGTVSTVPGSRGFQDFGGTPMMWTQEFVQAVAVDGAGNLYASYERDRFIRPATYYQSATVRKIASDGTFSIVAGVAGVIGSADGMAAQAAFDHIRGIAVDTAGAVYLADAASHAIRRISATGEVTTLAGLAATAGSTDGVGREARFYFPTGVALDASGNLYVTSGELIRKGRRATTPVITTQPQSQTVAAGGSVQFSVTATGAPDPTYQWYFNGNAFSGATNSTLSFTNARSSDAGEYTVLITNSLGSVTSAKATLTVNAPTPPPSSGGGSGGGGAPSVWFAASLAVLAILRFQPRAGG